MDLSLDVRLKTNYEDTSTYQKKKKEISITEHLSELYPLILPVVALMILPLRTSLISSCYEEDAA